MADGYQEWIDRRQTVFPVGNVASEQLVIGDPIDVGDWEEAIVQVDTLAVTNYSPSDISLQLQTTISQDTHPLWDNVFSAATTVSPTIDQNYIFKINAASSPNAPLNPLRKWLRLIAIHNATTAGENITVHAALLLKKQTP